MDPVQKSKLTILSENIPEENVQLLSAELFPIALKEMIVIPSDNYSRNVCGLSLNATSWHG